MKVAIITVYQYVGLSTPIQYLSKILTEKECYIDVYCCKSVNKFGNNHFESDKIRIFEYENFTGQSEIRLLKFFFWIFKLINKEKYDVLLGIDTKGIITSTHIKILKKLEVKIGYFHLEFLNPTADKFDFRYHTYRFLEKISHKKSDFTIGLDKYRTNMLFDENKIKNENVINISNLHYEADINSINTKRKNCDLKTYTILNLGSFTNDAQINEILDNIYFDGSSVKYIFHGWPGNLQIERRLISINEKQSKKFHFSKKFLPMNKYRELLKNADIGLAYYNPLERNSKVVGAASGKLFEYWRFGIPVICLKNTGMDYLVEGEGAGLCINAVDFKKAIEKIILNNKFYSINAKKAFDKYEKLNDHNKIFNQFNKFIKKQ